jgi:phage protein U
MISSIGDLSKAAGGKFNLNAMLGVNMMMILGAYRFCIGNAAYQNLVRSTEYNWVEQKRITGEPAMQFVGSGMDSIKLDGVIYPQFKGGLRQVALMRAQAGLGIPLMLISGNGMAFGRWCITDISETQTTFMADGTARKIAFSLTLKKYGENALPGALGVVQKLVGAL